MMQYENIKPIYEFILWDNCSNNCSFCWQKKHGCNLNNQQKINALEQIIDFLNSDKISNNEHILLVGGEIFDQSDGVINEKLLQAYRIILKKQSENKLGYLYINTNLIYSNINILLELLNIISSSNQLHKVRFTTSYDIYGRFSNSQKEQQFYQNLDIVNSVFNNKNIIINSILTKQACYDIIENTNNSFFDVLMKKYYVNLIPYISIDNDARPDKKCILNALRLIYNRYPGYIEKNIKNLDLKQDKLVYRYVNGQFKFCSSSKSSCNHGINFTKYSKDGTCYICDIKNFFNL